MEKSQPNSKKTKKVVVTKEGIDNKLAEFKKGYNELKKNKTDVHNMEAQNKVINKANQLIRNLKIMHNETLTNQDLSLDEIEKNKKFLDKYF